jgi:hypothetical protein
VASDQHTDPVTVANQRIRQHIRSCGGSMKTRDQRAEYERLVDAYFTAIGQRDRGRGDEEPARLAA